MLKSLRLIFIFSFLLVLACSSDGPPCGSTVCSSGEVCESGICVLGLQISGNEDSEGCGGDEDCPSGKVCTGTHSEPSSVCIPHLDCDRDSDCQSGLQCGADGLCR